MHTRGAGLALADGPGGAPEIVKFEVNPRVINRGQSVTLSWQTRGAGTVAIEWAPQNQPRGKMVRRAGLPASGTLVVQPPEDTVYVLECEADEGRTCMTMSATVRVR